MLRPRFAAFLFAGFLSTGFLQAASMVAVLPLFNVDEKRSPNLDWVGESVAETIRENVDASGMLALSREDREEVYRRLAVRGGPVLTRATVIKIGQTLDAGIVVFGQFKIDGAENGNANARSNILIHLHTIDLSRMRPGHDFQQSGQLQDLSKMETRLAWVLLKDLLPETPAEDVFTQQRPAIRIDAMENYVRGLMATSEDQRLKLFSQAARIEDGFSQAHFQIGRIQFNKKDYKKAAAALARVTRADSHFMEASFLLGICRFHEGEFDEAIQLFRAVAEQYPLNEVYNNLGAALSRRNDPAAFENFGKALEGDEADPDYWFNTGYWLWRNRRFAEAAEKFRAVLDRSQNDAEATSMLGRSIRQDGPRAGDTRTEGRERLKTTFEDSAFRQLLAEMKNKTRQ